MVCLAMILLGSGATFIVERDYELEHARNFTALAPGARVVVGDQDFVVPKRWKQHRFKISLPAKGAFLPVEIHTMPSRPAPGAKESVLRYTVHVLPGDTVKLVENSCSRFVFIPRRGNKVQDRLASFRLDARDVPADRFPLIDWQGRVVLKRPGVTAWTSGDGSAMCYHAADSFDVNDRHQQPLISGGWVFRGESNYTLRWRPSSPPEVDVSPAGGRTPPERQSPQPRNLSRRCPKLATSKSIR